MALDELERVPPLAEAPSGVAEPANHAGGGVWKGITNGNSNFIGIEAENTGRANDPWPEIQLDAYRDAGVGHVVAEPAQRTVDDYLRSIEALAEIFGAAGVTMTP